MTPKSHRCNVYIYSALGAQGCPLESCARRNIEDQVPPAALKAWHIRSGQGQPSRRVGHFPPQARGAGKAPAHWDRRVLLRDLRRVVGGVHGGGVCVIGLIGQGGPRGHWLCKMWEPMPGQIFPDKLVRIEGLDRMWPSSNFLWSAQRQCEPWQQ